MLFNSVQFAIFFFTVYALYLLLSHQWQNKLLLVASYLFYAAWDWRFLALIWTSTAIDYFCGLKIEETKHQKEKKRFLILSITSNLTLLGIFKYFNFFAHNFQALFQTLFGFEGDPLFLNIILPIGISFYTFQSMSYTIDLYRGQLRATRSFSDFALFVAFFPQLVAGPIERAKNLLPQILKKRTVTLKRFCDGVTLTFWGLFLKVFVADNLARLVNPVFANEGPYQSTQVLIALYAFSFQIFADFAGYSKIARGVACCMGFDIMVNFNLPFFARNIQDYWQRWHISLSGWIRDYLFTPLFLSLRSLPVKLRLYTALLLSMALMGLWHGASWIFVIWGLYHGCLLVSYSILKPLLFDKIKPSQGWSQFLWLVSRIVFLFHLNLIAFLIFRSQSLSQLGQMARSIVAGFSATPEPNLEISLLKLIIYASPMIAIEFFQLLKKESKLNVGEIPWFSTGLAYFVILFLLVTFGMGGANEFIYFQF
jgi:alginate O-acetyltransferase complex protein AlgI